LRICQVYARKEVIYTFSVEGDAEDVIGIEYLEGAGLPRRGLLRFVSK
jgi:hypothetical protein